MQNKRSILVMVLLVAAALGFAGDEKLSPALASIFEAERAFARRCGEVGIRASFTEFFADDGIAFYPQPVKYKDAIKNRPAPPNPLAFSLVWEPVFGDVSAAGDLGYDTGPSVLSDPADKSNPPRYGFFFSVWKKQADGKWKVALDIGTDTKTPYTGSRQGKAARTAVWKDAGKTNADADRAGFSEVERGFSGLSATAGAMRAYAHYLNEEARLHRDGMEPLTAREDIVAYLTKTPAATTWQSMFVDVSQSGDMGYSYGSYESKPAGAQDAVAERGFYARVWKKDQSGAWKLVADITKPQPPEQK